MHNHHVYVYFRFKSWVAGQTGKYMRQWFMHEFAEQELSSQQNVTPP